MIWEQRQRCMTERNEEQLAKWPPKDGDFYENGPLWQKHETEAAGSRNGMQQEDWA